MAGDGTSVGRGGTSAKFGHERSPWREGVATLRGAAKTSAGGSPVIHDGKGTFAHPLKKTRKRTDENRPFMVKGKSLLRRVFRESCAMTLADRRSKAKKKASKRKAAPPVAAPSAEPDPLKALASAMAKVRAKPGPGPKSATPRAKSRRSRPAPAALPTDPAPVQAAPAATASRPEAPSSPRRGSPPPPPPPPPPSESGTSWPDASEWAAILVRVALQSRERVQDYLSHRPASPAVLPVSDFAPMIQAFSELTGRLLDEPDRLTEAHLAFWQDYVRLCQAALARAAGQEAEPVVTPRAGDRRFQDPAWREVWLFDFIKQSYLLATHLVQDLAAKADGLSPLQAQRIEFYTRQATDACAPTNFWITNPEVLRKTAETHGENLIKGLDNLLTDLERGHGRLAISLSDTQAFRLGETLATTPGKVVFQNELFQLLQYTPQTPKTFQTPLLIVPPWINKYYVLDLREKNSFIRYLVAEGHTVFCVSWVNPDARHKAIGFEDYLDLGLLTALREAGRAAGAHEVNVMGYCIGGTLLASALAYIAALGPKAPADLPHVRSATYLTTLVDFSEPGDLGVFINDEQISLIEERMEEQGGYLDAYALTSTFNILRANDLVWSFVINNYLLGKEPFPFDLLAWNMDATNLPAAMQSFYLRNMYLKNLLMQPDGLAMKGVPLDMRRITTPTFLMAARDDHIAPWRSVYTATQLYGGPVTFVLADSGHIAGVVNPPAANKYAYMTNAKLPPEPEAWLADGESQPGSWWPAWMQWLADYAGPRVPAREPGALGPVIEDAPGSYVKVRAG